PPPRLPARARACISVVPTRAPVPGSARQTPPTTPAHITRAPRGADGSLTAPLGGQPRRSRVAGSSRLTAPARAGGCVPERWSVMASGGQRPATARTSTNGGWRPLTPAICGCSTPQAAAASPHGAVNGRGDRLERGRGDRGVDPHAPDDLPAHFALHIGGSGGVPALGECVFGVVEHGNLHPELGQCLGEGRDRPVTAGLHGVLLTVVHDRGGEDVA